MNGKESEPQTLLIQITPPWYLSTWAYIFYFIIIALLCILAVYRIIGQYRRKQHRIIEKLNREKKEEVYESKLRFFTNITHEFCTPLTLIYGPCEKILAYPQSDSYIRKYGKMIQQNTEKLNSLILELLEFRRLETGHKALSIQRLPVSDKLRNIAESFCELAENKNLNYQLDIEPDIEWNTDISCFNKIANNLISNAFKYTPSNGTIILSVNVDEGKQTLQIQVSDTGVGIPKEKQNELFKRFMQSNFSGDSIGVGLHLSHELVQVHKGTIEYKDNEGGGSVFTVCIPTDKTVYSEKDFLVPGNVLLKEADGHAHHLLQLSEELPDPEKMAAPLNKRKVLIIEDDNDIREFLREEIGAYFEVEVAADGTSGFEKARTYDADLIICDVLMPGMTGFEVTKKLKTDFDTSHIPIILLTALNSPEKHLEGIEAGADAYIAKPFSVKLLLARVFRLIEQRDKLREKFSNEPGIVRPAMCTTDRDKEFADRLAAILEQNLARPEFSIDEFAQLMKLGRTVFYRKLRGVTGYSPNEYLRVVRMKKAAELLLSEDNLTVAEVSYKVGISDPFYFSKCFKAQFGVAPSVYQRGVNSEGDSM